MAKKEMDKLAWENAQALACHMSYGKWKAMQQPVKIDKDAIPEGWVKCEYCGKPFKKKHNKRFCDVYCRSQAYYEKEKEIKEKYRKKKEGATNG